jgi:hypothetical protein
VRKAWCNNIGDFVAVKELVNTKVQSAESFERECRVLKSMEHPNVVHFVGACDNPKLLMAFEGLLSCCVFGVFLFNKKQCSHGNHALFVAA